MSGRFWENVDLEELTREEWESLCDGCARCCVYKLRDEDGGDIMYTNVACRLLDLNACRCSRYEERRELVPECVVLNAAMRDELLWLPATCAYRLLAAGKQLPSWHPLVTGDPNSTRDAGMSARARVIPECEAGDLIDHIVDIQHSGG